MNMCENRKGKTIQAEKDGPPPFLRTWNRIYIAIALFTIALILMLYLITVTLNR